MSASAWHGSSVIRGDVLTPHEFVKVLPKSSDRLVFARHTQRLFELAVQDIARG